MNNSFLDIIGKSLAKEHIYWGYHTIIDARGCDESTVNSGSTLKSCILKLVQELKMIPVGEPVLYEFNDGNGRGASCIQLVTTSHFSAHSDDQSMAAYIDIFSCEKYNPEVAIAIVKEFFNPKEMACKFILRDPGILKDESTSYIR